MLLLPLQLGLHFPQDRQKSFTHDGAGRDRLAAALAFLAAAAALIRLTEVVTIERNAQQDLVRGNCMQVARHRRSSEKQVLAGLSRGSASKPLLAVHPRPAHPAYPHKAFRKRMHKS